MFTRFAVAVVIVLSVPPAMAAGGRIQISEPGDAALFVVAVIGLIIGRQASRRAPRPDKHPDDTQV